MLAVPSPKAFARWFVALCSQPNPNDQRLTTTPQRPLTQLPLHPTIRRTQSHHSRTHGRHAVEFKEVIGRRRSIRFFDPDRPVEREKIQKMLEAARLASCAVNAQWARAVVGFRDDLTDDQLKRLKTPVAGLNVELAPVHIHFFNDLGVVNRNQGAPLRELVDVGALAPTHGWSHKFVDDFVYPQILRPMTQGPGYPIASSFDVGVAVCQALLTGVDEGLGVGLVTLNGATLKEVFKVPEDWIPLPTILVGYPAESWDGGGQRPRPP